MAPLLERPRGLLDVRRLVGWVVRHRRRFAPLVLGAAVIAIGTPLLEATPRETDVHLDFGGDHGRITSVQITYERESVPVHGVRLNYAEGAPRRVRQQSDLPPGHYKVHFELRGTSLHRDVTRSMTVPAEGQVHFRLTGDSHTEST